MTPIKAVLISENGYDSSKVRILEDLLANGLVLFCAVGKDCELWEQAMDCLCESADPPKLSVATTSHPGETTAQVIEFANTWPEHGEVRCIAV